MYIYMSIYRYIHTYIYDMYIICIYVDVYIHRQGCAPLGRLYTYTCVQVYWYRDLYDIYICMYVYIYVYI